MRYFAIAQTVRRMTPLYLSHGLVYPMTELNAAQLGAFVGFASVDAFRTGQVIGVYADNDPVDGFDGLSVDREYYLSLAGPIVRDDVPVGGLSRRVGFAMSARQMLMGFGIVETPVSATGSAFAALSGFQAITSYPATAVRGRIVRCQGAGGVLNLPAGSGLSEGAALEVWNESAGAVTITPDSGDVIDDGLTSYSLPAPALGSWHKNGLIWTGTEWGIR